MLTVQIIECNVIEVVSNELRNTDLGNNVIASAIPGRSLNAKKDRKICHVRNFTFYVKSKGFLSKVHFAIETYFYEET